MDRNDVADGLSVGWMLVQKWMGYAGLAGRPRQYGFYAVIVALVVYAVVRTSRHLGVGPEYGTGVLADTAVATVANANALTTGQQKIRLQVFGTTLRFKIWSASVAEPASWSWSGTDASLATAGQFWISEVRGSTNVGDKALLIDDFSISPTA